MSQPGGQPSVGRPKLPWTSSLNRKLVRIRLGLGLEWDDVVTAIAEDDFTPKRSAVIKQLKQFEIGPAQHLQNTGVRKLRDGLIRAFKRHREHKSSGVEHAPVLPQVEQSASTNTFGAFISSFRDLQPPLTHSAANDSPAPSLCMDEQTPIDPIPETQTPQDGTGLLHTPTFDTGKSTLPPHPDNLAIIGTSQSEIQRPTFVDFDSSDATQNLSRSRSKKPGKQKRNQNQKAAVSRNQASDIENPGQRSAELEAVFHDQKEAVAAVEDKNELPRGLINWLKYSLTISRNSISSTLSFLSSPRTSYRANSVTASSSFPQTTQFDNTHNNLLPNETDQRRPRPEQPTLSRSRAGTNLHWELRLGGDPDDEVAKRLRQLIEDGANVNAQNESGATALHRAVELGNLPACQVLLDHGAMKSIQTHAGNDVLRHGKIAQKTTKDEGENYGFGKYARIDACRNLIRTHTYPPPGKYSKLVGSRDEPRRKKRKIEEPKRSEGLSDKDAPIAAWVTNQALQLPASTAQAMTTTDPYRIGDVPEQLLFKTSDNGALGPTRLQSPPRHLSNSHALETLDNPSHEHNNITQTPRYENTQNASTSRRETSAQSLLKHLPLKQASSWPFSGNGMDYEQTMGSIPEDGFLGSRPIMSPPYVERPMATTGFQQPISDTNSARTAQLTGYITTISNGQLGLFVPITTDMDQKCVEDSVRTSSVVAVRVTPGPSVPSSTPSFTAPQVSHRGHRRPTARGHCRKKFAAQHSASHTIPTLVPETATSSTNAARAPEATMPTHINPKMLEQNLSLSVTHDENMCIVEGPIATAPTLDRQADHERMGFHHVDDWDFQRHGFIY